MSFPVLHYIIAAHTAKILVPVVTHAAPCGTVVHIILYRSGLCCAVLHMPVKMLRYCNILFVLQASIRVEL